MHPDQSEAIIRSCNGGRVVYLWNRGTIRSEGLCKGTTVSFTYTTRMLSGFEVFEVLEVKKLERNAPHEVHEREKVADGDELCSRE